jgi:biopolymer transport protein ExbD
MASTTTSGRGRGGAITGINVTPLVDVTLVLLIIFMVTAKLIVNHSAMTVDLPKAASGSDVQEILSVVLAFPTGTEVNGERLGDDEGIAIRARGAAAKDKDVRAVIKADGAIPHSRVMHVLDVLRESGVSKIGFGVTPVPPVPAPAAGPAARP